MNEPSVPNDALKQLAYRLRVPCAIVEPGRYNCRFCHGVGFVRPLLRECPDEHSLAHGSLSQFTDGCSTCGQRGSRGLVPLPEAEALVVVMRWLGTTRSQVHFQRGVTNETTCWITQFSDNGADWIEALWNTALKLPEAQPT